MRWLPYLTAWLFPPVTIASLWLGGAWTFALPVLAFGLIPALELLLKPDTRNKAPDQEAQDRTNPLFDVVLVALIPVHIATCVLLAMLVRSGHLHGVGVVGGVFAVGVACGVYGINLGHELGHRREKWAKRMAVVALSTSLYAHFIIEHNRGHHARVSTDEDPASSRRGETLYAFWIRSVRDGWLSAWALEAKRLDKKGLRRISWHNEMLRLTVLQGVLAAGAVAAFGWGGVAWIGAAAIGALMLETVNYIEHYGLQREKTAAGRYERVRPVHSWNSDHPIGRALLFELSRHSDHHAHPGRPYPALRHFQEAPQMPTGYPGMMVLSILPPLWFRVMDPRVDAALGRQPTGDGSPNPLPSGA